MSFRRRNFFLVFLFVSAALLPVSMRPQDHEHAVPGEKLGAVHFETSCNAAVEPGFNRAVALLHSFEFSQAIGGFQEVLQADPDCAMAYWGIALSRWGNPFAAGVKTSAQVKQGLEAIDHAKKPGAKTDRERGFIAAAGTLFVDSEKIDQSARVTAYEGAMASLASKYPEDHEASIFYALSLAAAAPASDKTYRNQLKAGAILEKLFKEEPGHPGITHYIIHTYDVPALAGKALDAARRYSDIAPSAPHALHMPSHTFTRVGSWQESIDTNIASAAAARRAGSTAEELHAMDYQAYAYLQTSQDRAAKGILDALPEVEGRFNPDAIGGAAPGSAGVFALAAMPARWALERRAWKEAARLEASSSKFPYAEAMTHLVRALGAAHTGDMTSAKASIESLQEIKRRLIQTNETYWTEQTEIQLRIATAWLAFAEKRPKDALAMMKDAAAMEDGTEKNAVTPGPIAPARELFGEMLLDYKQAAEALKNFQATLQKEPNRFRALYGAARAASLAGDRAAARRYYTQLLRVCERGDNPGRPELEEARRAVKQ